MDIRIWTAITTSYGVGNVAMIVERASLKTVASSPYETILG